MDWTIGLLDYISSYFLDHFLGPFFWINFWTILWGGGWGGRPVVLGAGKDRKFRDLCRLIRSMT